MPLLLLCKGPGESKNESFQTWCESAFLADSGFVNPTQARQLLRLICQQDSTVFQAAYCKFLNSTAQEEIVDFPAIEGCPGKYYRGPDTDGIRQWVLCLLIDLDGWHPHVFEFQERQGQFEWVGYALYPNGNYPCCWEGEWREFLRVGSYFFLETCSTGSGFCSGDAHVLFFPLTTTPEDSIDSTLPIYMYQSMWQPRLTETLVGELKMRGDTIVADYRYQADSIIENAAGEDERLRLSERRFSAFFQVDTKGRKVVLLNRDSVMRMEEVSWIFDN